MNKNRSFRTSLSKKKKSTKDELPDFRFISLILIFYSLSYYFNFTPSPYYLDPNSLMLPYFITGILFSLFIILIFAKTDRYFAFDSKGGSFFYGILIFFFLFQSVFVPFLFEYLNHFLDQSGPQKTNVIITEIKTIKTVRKGRSIYHHYWYFKHFQETNNLLFNSIRVVHKSLSIVKVGDQFEFVTKKGNFNYPYLISIKKIQIK